MIHQPPTPAQQPTPRRRRARSIDATYPSGVPASITPVGLLLYQVSSESNPAEEYTWDEFGQVCNCPNFDFGGPGRGSRLQCPLDSDQRRCKHGRLVWTARLELARQWHEARCHCGQDAFMDGQCVECYVDSAPARAALRQAGPEPVPAPVAAVPAGARGLLDAFDIYEWPGVQR